MHIIIAEKDTDGQKILRRILKTDGYEVSIAETGNHVVGLLKEPHINIVLMNVFQYMYSSDAVPEQKLNIRKIKAANQALLVTCGISENWRRFSLLMDLPTDAYLGCRFLR